MQRNRTGVFTNLIAGFLAANLLLFVGMASVHHHAHDPKHTGAESPGQCSVCLAAQGISSADHWTPAAFSLQQDLAAFPSFCFAGSFEIEKSVWLQHPVVHGPPSV